jgi:cell division septal protein FtsQ
MKKSSWILLFLFVFLVSVGFFMRSSFFEVQSIQVDANSLEIKKLVEKSLADYQGKNMWELELEDMTSMLGTKSVAIQSVVFQRHWPATLKVRVEERIGVAQTFIDRDLWMIDKEGVSFRKKAEALPLFWPLPADRKNYVETLEWLARDKPRGVNGLTWDKELGLVLYSDQKIKIILGRENYSENWKKAAETLQYLKSKGLQTRRIDATYNNRAVVSL